LVGQLSGSYSTEEEAQEVTMKRLIFLTTLLVFSLSGTVYADLIAYYPFGGNANDESGNGYDGTVFGASMATDRCGNAENAYSFDGEVYIKIATDDFKQQPFSVGVWVKATDIDYESAIIGYENGVGYYGWLLWTTQDGKARYQLQSATGGPIAIADTDTVITDNTWHFIVATDDSTTLRIYVDGKLENSSSSTTTLWASTMYAYFGAGRPEHELAGNWFNGTIDDARLYNHALSEAEVQKLYSTPVPEPSTLLLLGSASLFGVAFRKRFRK
jgi:hypothetical protein